MSIASRSRWPKACAITHHQQSIASQFPPGPCNPSIFRCANIFLVEACPDSPQRCRPIAERGESRALFGGKRKIFGQVVRHPPVFIRLWAEVGRCPKFFRPPRCSVSASVSAALAVMLALTLLLTLILVSTRKKSAQRKIESPHAGARRPLRRNAHRPLRLAKASFHAANDLHRVDGTPDRT